MKVSRKAISQIAIEVNRSKLTSTAASSQEQDRPFRRWSNMIHVVKSLCRPHSLAPLALFFILAGPVATVASSQPHSSVATINGTAIYESDLVGVEPQLRKQEYELKRKALDSVLPIKLLEAEAARLGVSVEELVSREVNSKVSDPPGQEVEAFYLGQQDRIQRPFSEVEAQMWSALRQARLTQARQEYVNGLRQKADVVILLDQPRTEIAPDQAPARLKGPVGAPVRIVEFSDFECPYCRSVQETIRRVLAKYQGQASLDFRDFPLNNLHPRAQLAAEASRCAAEQGKFWEYHDRLFEGKLEVADLKGHAKAIGLNSQTFDACLDGRKQQEAVDQDVMEGRAAGVGGTPAFFINGIALIGGQPASAFEQIIEDELRRKR
jgi:protein-disulfide isomerase